MSTLSLEYLWEKAKERLNESIPEVEFDTWIRPIRIVRLENKILTIEVPNRFFLDWIQEHYLYTLEGILKQVIGEDLLIRIQVAGRSDIYASYPKQIERYGLGPTYDYFRAKSRLNPKYRFENFVVGESNHFAHATSLAVANLQASNYNPLFIHGGVGLGKTHLLNAIGHKILENNAEIRLNYTTAEEFTNELAYSNRYEKIDDFRTRFRNTDILLIDDIQFLSGRERTQEEFFYTFNTLYEKRKQIVITSDKFPKEIQSIEERLRSRFEWGVIAEIGVPDIETRLAILKKKAEESYINLPEDVALFIATHVDSNVRELEGFLIRIEAFSRLSGTRIDIDLADQLLSEISKGRHKEVTIEQIQKGVCNFFNIKLSDIKSKKKSKSISQPRQIAMYLSRKITNASFSEIGSRFGGKDHSTVIHAIKKVEERMKRDGYLKSTIESIEKNIT